MSRARSAADRHLQPFHRASLVCNAMRTAIWPIVLRARPDVPPIVCEPKAGAANEPKLALEVDRSKVDLSKKDVTITINLREGEMAATIWTTDLSHAYVHENSAYSS